MAAPRGNPAQANKSADVNKSGERRVTYSMTDDHSLIVHAAGEVIIQIDTDDKNINGNTPAIKDARRIIKELGGPDEAEFESFKDSQSIDPDLNKYLGATRLPGPVPAGAAGAPGPVPAVKFARLFGVDDPVLVARRLLALGYHAQPNHVHSAHLRNGASLVAGPAYATFYAAPAYATPAYATPAYATPAYATPAYATPAYATPAYATAASSPAARTDAVVPTSSATPAAIGQTTNAIFARLDNKHFDNGAYVFLLDTGLIDLSSASTRLKDLLQDRRPPVKRLGPKDRQDKPGDPMPFAAGHGTFIGTLISQLARGCRVSVGQVLDESGLGDEWTVAQRINELTTVLSGLDAGGESVAARSILNLSFGATALNNRPYLLEQVILNIQSIGVLVVASAGDDAKTKEVFPAALPGVVGVGAIGPTGPAPFTNYGSWVTACAPGVELISAFFGGPGKEAWRSGADYFEGWAIWSGTSFSAPVVAGTLARFMMAENAANPGKPTTTAHQAKKRLIDAPWLLRVPNLGTVVNVV